MPFPQALSLSKYWDHHPPTHELLAIGMRVFTTWRPREADGLDGLGHQRSLEHRWKNGGYLNVKQMFDGQAANSNFTVLQPGAKIPGIGPFPGTVQQVQGGGS